LSWKTAVIHQAYNGLRDKSLPENGGFVLENEPTGGGVLGSIDRKSGGFRALLRSREDDIHGTREAKESGDGFVAQPQKDLGQAVQLQLSTGGEKMKIGGWGHYRMVLECSVREWYTAEFKVDLNQGVVR